MIELQNVKKAFNKHKKNRIDVINNTSLKFDNTGLVALLGPSGSGKTTLLNAIGGLDKVGSGKIFIDGVKITKVSSRKVDKVRNLNIGYIFQDYKLIENKTVFENVAIVLKMLGYKDKKEIEERVLYTLEKVNMLRYIKRPVSMLSGGERQRVGIARALAKNPKIIIADEPTGNLDSRNSIEIMNIIKNISKNRLVILVTHEEELAKFYASRIIEIKDGKVINDYANDNTKTLDYRIENKIYLKDFNHHNSLKKDKIDIDVYYDNLDEVKLDIVFKNGNIYIKTNSDDKVEIVENNIELVNDHYKEIKEVNLSEHEFELAPSKHKEKYTSIFRLGSFITTGFKKLLDYPLVKKILLGGFFLSGIFIFYAVSSGFASINIEDKDFVDVNVDYLASDVRKLSVNEYTNFENDSSTKFIMPSDSKVAFLIKFDDYYQSSNNTDTLVGSLSDINDISSKELIYGVMPSGSKEIVVDKMAIDKVLKKIFAIQVGFNDVTDFLNRKVYLKGLGEYEIVGITDVGAPNIYTSVNSFLAIINSSYEISNNMYHEETSDVSEDNMYLSYLDVNSDYTLSKGNNPTGDYEVIVSSDKEFEMPLNKTIDMKVNGKKLKVVGYFKSDTLSSNVYLTNSNTIKYNLITKANSITVSSNNQDKTIELFNQNRIDLKSSYEKSKDEYIKDQKESIKKTLLVSGIILLISLIEILLMIRSSFLSRIKEVGIYRAIGVKKSDIYKMFVGEIIAITSIATIPGILFMAYCLYNLSKIELLSNMFMVNVFTVLISIILVYLFNIIVGLIPVFNTIRKTPASILSRQDVN